MAKRAAIRSLCASRRREAQQGVARYEDLAIDFVSEVDGEILFSVGGKWDRRRKEYVGEADRSRRFMLHPGQLEAARWFGEWFAARANGQHLTTPVLEKDGRTEVERNVWSAGLVGGRRGGKTDEGTKLSVGFAVFRPRSRVWLVSEDYPKTEELDLVIQTLIPRQWIAERLGAPWYRYKLINGSWLWLRSAHNPEDLKRGRVDFAMMNEAQNIEQRAYNIIRPATADRGGLVLVVANPPEEAVGQWVMDFVERTRAKRRQSKVFVFDAKANPHVEIQSLQDLEREFDERTYRIEILGEFLPRRDVVFYNYSEDNCRPTPDTGEVTGEFLRQHHGRQFACAVGMDFQKSPHMAAVIYRMFADPDDDSKPLLWIADECIVENATEDDLLDELEGQRFGLDGKDVAVIADASGDWQDAERTKGRGSFDVLKRRGWRFVFKPDAKSQRNPDIVERCKVGNIALGTADGVRRLFHAPECYHTQQALKKWENRNGTPYRRSIYAHVGDAVTYPLYRWFPRRVRTSKFEYHAVEMQPSQRRRDFEGY